MRAGSNPIVLPNQEIGANEAGGAQTKASRHEQSKAGEQDFGE
jgi:hypothetical protein